MKRHWWRWKHADRRIRFAASAWVVVAGLGLLVGLELLIDPWIHKSASRGGEAAVAPAVWLAIDFLFVIWVFTPQLICLGLAVSAWATWRVAVRRQQLLLTAAARGLVLGGAALSSLAAIVLALLLLPSALALVTRTLLCETSVFEVADSPNGRYRATVAEVDCGAMSGFNRQVLLTRRPFWWAAQSILYFRRDPSLHLSWNRRTLTISGDRTLGSMHRQPPDPMLWGGVLARYSGPKE